MENKNEQQVPEIMPEPIEEPKKSKKGQMAKGVAKSGILSAAA